MYSMTNKKINKFNDIITELIKKSQLTQRQFEIILNEKEKEKTRVPITSGAYYRQVKQIRIKLNRLQYTILLLSCFEIIDENTINIILKLAKQISLIKYSNQIMDNNKIILVINQLIKQTKLL